MMSVAEIEELSQLVESSKRKDDSFWQALEIYATVRRSGATPKRAKEQTERAINFTRKVLTG